jgi:hypothetical protein
MKIKFFFNGVEHNELVLGVEVIDKVSDNGEDLRLMFPGSVAAFKGSRHIGKWWDNLGIMIVRVELFDGVCFVIVGLAARIRVPRTVT